MFKHIQQHNDIIGYRRERHGFERRVEYRKTALRGQARRAGVRLDAMANPGGRKIRQDRTVPTAHIQYPYSGGANHSLREMFQHQRGVLNRKTAGDDLAGQAQRRAYRPALPYLPAPGTFQ